MKFFDFLIDKILLLMLHIFCMVLLAAFLHTTNYPDGYCVIILICWGFILFIWFLIEYIHRNNYFQQMKQIPLQKDQPCLLGELMPRSFRLEDRLYRELIHRSNKSVLERIRKLEDTQKEYREYIEGWVHEIKAPILNIFLFCENYKENPVNSANINSSFYNTESYSTDKIRKIFKETRKIENYVDMALYYARSDDVYKDYLIKETGLQQAAQEILTKNKYYLIQNKICAEVHCTDTVYTDIKWISFILNQLVLNAVKYRNNEQPKIWIYTQKQDHSVLLITEDNGIGICAQDLPRIFEKGFTGSNGRINEKLQQRSTGMGLYLCKKLCTKLGIQIYALSEEGRGSKLILEFPVSNYVAKISESIP